MGRFSFILPPRRDSGGSTRVGNGVVEIGLSARRSLSCWTEKGKWKGKSDLLFGQYENGMEQFLVFNSEDDVNPELGV